MSKGLLGLGGTSQRDFYLGSAPANAAPLTISCWYVDWGDRSVTASSVVDLHNSAAAGSRECLRITSGGAAAQLVVRAHVGSTNANTSAGSIAVGRGQWHHAAAVFVASTSRLAYVDGNTPGSGGNTQNTSGINELNIGRQRNTSTFIDPTYGFIAEVAIWNVALNRHEVIALAQGASPVSIRPANLKAYWPLRSGHPPVSAFGGVAALSTTLGTANTPSDFEDPDDFYFGDYVKRALAQKLFTPSGTTVNCTAGSATASGVKALLDATLVTATGSATASGVAAKLDVGVNCTAGSATASGTRALLDVSIGTTAATATASGVAASIETTAPATINCTAATATASGVAAKLDVAFGTAAATATASGVASKLDVAFGTTAATATASGTKALLDVSLAATAATATASGVAASIEAGAGSPVTINCTAATATASGVKALLDESVSCSAGTATASGVACNLDVSIGATAATATASGVAVSLDVGIGCTPASATSSGVSALLDVTVNTIVVPSTASGIKALIEAQAALTDDEKITAIYKILFNKQITDPDTGVLTVYDDDDTNGLYEADIYENVAGSVAYRGQGIDRRNKYRLLGTPTPTLGTTSLEIDAIYKFLFNKQVTDPNTGVMTVYDDDNTTVFASGNIYENKTAGQAYRGQGIERREKLAPGN